MDNFVKTSLKIIKESLNIKKGEKIGLIIDHNSSITRAFIRAFKILDLDYRLIKIPLKRKNSSSIPRAKKDILNCNVIIAPTKNSITHSKEVILAKKIGIRGASLPGVYDKLFLKILNTNLKEIDKLNYKLYKKVKNSKQIIVKTKTGTNIEIKLDPKRRWVLDNSIMKNGSIGNLPCGEVFVAPLENEANGVINIDGWKNITSKDKAIIYVKNGEIFSYNKKGKKYYDYLARTGKSSLTIAEFGIGTNKTHKKIIGNILHDEKIFKSCHIAFGVNVGFGGKNKSDIHEDVILISPEISIDGKKLNLNLN